jgi:hypothetical protein
MENSIIIKKIWFKNQNEKSDLNFNKYDNKNKDYIPTDKLSKEEWKAYIFGYYNNNIYTKRNFIIVKGKTKVKTGNIILKLNKNTIIGEGEIEKIEKNIYKITNLNPIIGKKNIEDLFIYYNTTKDLTKKEKNKYLNGLFRIHYKSIEYYINNYFNKGKLKSKNTKTIYDTLENKFSAYCSYQAVKEIFKENKFNISQLDCFIKGHRLEYDALILKDNVNPNNRLYEESDVLATIELKTSGFFSKKEQIKKDFKKYMEQEHIEGIPHIYITLHEKISDNKETINFYGITKEFFEKNKNEYYGIYCKLKKTNEYITIPKEYDLEKIIKNIKELIKKRQI